MIDLLRNRPGITIVELAASLGRSERTIYRWMNELTLDLRAPIYCNDGGYYLLSDAVNSKSGLTPEELLVVRMSLKSSPFTDGSPMKKQADSAWQKIKGSSSSEKLWNAGNMAGNYSVHITMPSSNLEPKLVETIDNAVTLHHRLNVVYRSQKSNKIKNYTVDPYAIVFRRHSWYIIGFCHEHDKVIQFKLARFKSAVDTLVEFDPPADFSVEEYFESSWEAWASDELVKVKIRFSPEVAEMIAEAKRHPTQVITPEPGGSVIYEVTVAGIEEIAIWVMGFGKDAEVLEPESLRNYVLDHALGIIARYSKTADSANNPVDHNR